MRSILRVFSFLVSVLLLIPLVLRYFVPRSPSEQLWLSSLPPSDALPFSRIAKLSMLLPPQSPALVRAVASHDAHNARWGYRSQILQRSMLDGVTRDPIWNKPAFVLSVLMEEMRKPPEHRLEWILYVDGNNESRSHGCIFPR